MLFLFSLLDFSFFLLLLKPLHLLKESSSYTNLITTIMRGRGKENTRRSIPWRSAFFKWDSWNGQWKEDHEKTGWMIFWWFYQRSQTTRLFFLLCSSAKFLIIRSRHDAFKMHFCLSLSPACFFFSLHYSMLGRKWSPKKHEKFIRLKFLAAKKSNADEKCMWNSS